MLTARAALVSVVATLAWACQLTSQTAPPLAGPSELALSLSVTAVPDQIAQDGQSQSLVTVAARGAGGQPVHGLALRLTMSVNGVSQDYGTLASKSLSTGANGQAATIYRAPPPPSAAATGDQIVRIDVVPVGTDSVAATPRSVAIRLARPGVILPPNPPLVPTFFVSPSQPHEVELVQFDASGAGGVIATWAWSFGDGAVGSGIRTTHRYTVAGTYNVTLTIVDDRGARATSQPAPLTVLTAADPIASFTISPTDPVAGDTVNFDASASTVPPGRSIVDYTWSFGDGSFGTGRTASHHYDKARTYTVGLTVTDSAGRTGVASAAVDVR